MENKLHVQIITPYGKYLVTDADFLSVTSSVAVLGILPNHAPLITTIEVCKLSIKINNVTRVYAVSGGILKIEKGSNVSLLLNSIEGKNDIDINRALKAKERAEERLQNKNDIDVIRAQSALSRALNRINVYNGEEK